jgi:hypothetical protein
MNAQANVKAAPPRAAAAFDLTGEAAGRAVQVFEGVWLIATRHRPGLSKHSFEVNNRCFVFRLADRQVGVPVLVVANAVDPGQAIPEVRRIERETGLEVRYILSPGGGHHLLLEPWHDEFTAAKVLVPPVRIPRIEHGQQLMRLPRVSKMSLEDPLPQFRGQLDAVIFHGLLGPSDHRSPGEGGKDTRLAFMGRMLKFMMRKPQDPVDELWLHHGASGTVIAGENLGWHYPAAALAAAPFMLRQMIKPDQVFIWTVPRRVGDAATVAACWRKVLAWPCRTLMTYHDAPMTAFVGDGNAALAAAVEGVGQLRA